MRAQAGGPQEPRGPPTRAWAHKGGPRGAHKGTEGPTRAQGAHKGSGGPQGPGPQGARGSYKGPVRARSAPLILVYIYIEKDVCIYRYTHIYIYICVYVYIDIERCIGTKTKQKKSLQPIPSTVCPPAIPTTACTKDSRSTGFKR